MNFERSLARWERKLEDEHNREETPCPKCGEPAVNDGLCSDCGEIERDEYGDYLYELQREREYNEQQG